jgi:hypothetical protein
MSYIKNQINIIKNNLVNYKIFKLKLMVYKIIKINMIVFFKLVIIFIFKQMIKKLIFMIRKTFN